MECLDQRSNKTQRLKEARGIRSDYALVMNRSDGARPKVGSWYRASDRVRASVEVRRNILSVFLCEVNEKLRITPTCSLEGSVLCVVGRL